MFNILSNKGCVESIVFLNVLGKYLYVRGQGLSQVCAEHVNNTYLTLHALGSASSGAIVRRLDSLPLSLVLQFDLLGVNALHTDWILQWLDWLLNALKENTV